jgi:hypothetical protein
MRLEPLYTVTFTTPEAWSVEAAGDGHRGSQLLVGRGALYLTPFGPLPRGELSSEAG